MSSTTLSNNYRPSTTTTFSKSPLTTTSPSPLSPRKKTMSITQTYYLAHKARAKLSTEAGRADHDLRLLVGHANLLDSLMLDLADAEREQESWFNQSVRGASAHEEEKTAKKERHVQWADDAIVEEPEEGWRVEDAVYSDSDSDTSDSDEYDSEDEDSDVEMLSAVSVRRLPLPASPALVKPTPQSTAILSVSDPYDEDEDDDDMEEDNLEEDYAQLELVRTPSHSALSPPELEHDELDGSSSDSDDDMPPSPPNTILSLSEKEAKEEEMHTQQQQEEQLQKGERGYYSDGFYMPRRGNPARLVSAISVY